MFNGAWLLLSQISILGAGAGSVRSSASALGGPQRQSPAERSGPHRAPAGCNQRVCGSSTKLETAFRHLGAGHYFRGSETSDAGVSRPSDFSSPSSCLQPVRVLSVVSAQGPRFRGIELEKGRKRPTPTRFAPNPISRLPLTFEKF